jgi:hypothetical protein
VKVVQARLGHASAAEPLDTYSGPTPRTRRGPGGRLSVAFFILAAFIAFESIRSLINQEEPDASTVGIILTAVSVVVMQWLARAKRRVGIAMGSKAVEADSAQTSACV